MATALDVITDALQMLGVYGAGDTVSTDDQALGLSVLNDMTDVWSNESLAAFCILTQSVALIAGQQSYTVGPGGNINGVRPLKILEDPGTCFVRDQNGNDYPVAVIPQDEWNLIVDKGVSSNIPDVLFYDPQFPLGVINLWGVPNIGGYTLYFNSYQQLGNFATVSATFSFPPGYKRAMGTNLAVCLKPYFADGSLDPLILKEAAETKGWIKRTNRREVYAEFDAYIRASGAGQYDIYNDNYSSRGN